ncbi:AMP-binding protein [Nonlabens antarcticus]|uniref:AMP-binding protein n=1 Tax=Nonlabens antarcticus TaxID=392714 RepID=UPI001891E2FF|nr:AMP-binding protein [Nonlabens antarcticus]
MIPEVHPSFKLNGVSLDHNGLMTVAYSYVKEGELWERQVGEFLLNWMDDFSYHTVFSSGSTGTPKEYRLEKQHMINSARLTGERFNLHAENDILGCLPLSYVAGKLMMVRAIELGLHIDLVAPSKNPLEKVTKRYDFTALTAYQVKHSLDHLYKSRKTIIGGGPVDEAMVESLKNRHTRAYHTYGMTETSTHIGVRELYPNYEEYFTALPGIKVRLNRADCLIIDAPELTKEPVISNDLAVVKTEKTFKILGRTDNVINTGGVKIHPESVENKLSKHLDSRFFIASEPEKDLGQQVILFVEGEETDLNSAFAKAKLDRFEKPRKVIFVKEFAETHTAKIDKKVIIAKYRKN